MILLQFGVISTCKFFKGNFIVFEKFTRIYQRGGIEAD